MKKILSIIIFILLATPTWSWATTWYACAGSKNIDSVSGGTTSDVWYSAAACTGGSYYTWTSTFDDGLSAADILEANAQTALAVNVNPGATGKKVHLKNTAGGGFTAVTSASPITINADITAVGGTCLAITGNANANPALTIVGTITGGDGASEKGVSDTHTVGTVVVTGDVTGGSNSTAYGYYWGGTSGAVTISGTVTANTGNGLNMDQGSGTASATVVNCVGAALAAGCNGAPGARITITGNVLDALGYPACNDNCLWVPSSAQKYHRVVTSTTGPTYLYLSAGLGDVDSTQIAAGDTAAQIKTTGYFIKKDDGVYTQGTATGGGGGAWGF